MKCSVHLVRLVILKKCNLFTVNRKTIYPDGSIPNHFLITGELTSFIDCHRRSHWKSPIFPNITCCARVMLDIQYSSLYEYLTKSERNVGVTKVSEREKNLPWSFHYTGWKSHQNQKVLWSNFSRSLRYWFVWQWRWDHMIYY